jgi:hypothetical protein
VDIIKEMVKISPSLKVWRGAIAELLNDNRFFHSHAETAMKWKGIMKALFDADKTAFPELLGKDERRYPFEKLQCSLFMPQAKSQPRHLQIILRTENTRCCYDH